MCNKYINYNIFMDDYKKYNDVINFCIDEFVISYLRINLPFNLRTNKNKLRSILKDTLVTYTG